METSNERPDTKSEDIKTDIELYEDTAPLQINYAIKLLLKKYIQVSNDKNGDYTPIHVDEMASKVAKFYELVRKVVDWKEDAVLRRNAIERILKRLIFTKISGVSNLKSQNVAEIVTMDLIRGGHLPNDTIPREYIPKVATCLRKYFIVLERSSVNSANQSTIKEKMNFTTFIVEIAACEIEDILNEPYKENLILLTMAKSVNERIKIIPETAFTPEDKHTQTFIACCRSLYELDDAYISYQLFKYQYPQWTYADDTFIEFLVQNMPTLKIHAENLLNHPLHRKFSAACESVDTVFIIIDDLIEKYKDNKEILPKIIANKQKTTELIGEFYDKRYHTLKTRLFRYGIFSTLSVFLSNSFTFFIIEVPVAHLFYEGFNMFTTLVDFLIPTALMFIMVSIIRPPPASNRQKVVDASLNYIYNKKGKQFIEIYLHQKRHPVLMAIVSILYVSLSIAIFSIIGWIFYIAGLPITSVIFDTFTIALTIFAAVIIRNKSKELTIEDKLHIWDYFMDTISIPIAKIGSVLAAKWKEYNIFTIFFNFVLETPFAFFVDFIESWSQYIKEKRAELH